MTSLENNAHKVSIVERLLVIALSIKVSNNDGDPTKPFFYFPSCFSVCVCL